MMLSPERYEELNQEAVNLLEDYGFRSFPLDVSALAARMGIALRPYSSIPHAKRQAFLDVSKDAFTIAEGEYEADATYICFDSNVSKGRLRHSIAHEIAHIWLEHPSHMEPYETEANYLAAYLLAPIPLVLKHTNLNAYEVESCFGVSYKAATIAIERAVNRMECRKPNFGYEDTLLRMCTVGGGGRLEIA